MYKLLLYNIYIYFNTDRITSSFVVDVYNNNYYYYIQNAVKFICTHKYALEAETVQRLKYVKARARIRVCVFLKVYSESWHTSGDLSGREEHKVRQVSRETQKALNTTYRYYWGTGGLIDCNRSK